MESHLKIDLLGKFSHAVWILQFYGKFSQVEKLMCLMCHSTHDQWVEHKEEYRNCLVNESKNLGEVEGKINKSIFDYIRKSGLFKKYAFILSLDNKGIKLLDEFLDSIDGIFEIHRITKLNSSDNDTLFDTEELLRVLKRHRLSGVVILECDASKDTKFVLDKLHFEDRIGEDKSILRIDSENLNNAKFEGGTYAKLWPLNSNNKEKTKCCISINDILMKLNDSSPKDLLQEYVHSVQKIITNLQREGY